MRFKTDENLPREVADYLIETGHDALSVDAQGLAGVADVGIAAVCLVERRAIITLDTDFMDVRQFPPDHYAGIIVLRPHRQSVPRILALVRRVVLLLNVHPLIGKLWIVDEVRVRIRPDDPTE
jgi:predicted nuclease of predicted toxin-antitoxin system